MSVAPVRFAAVAFAALALAGTACQEDDPATELPCEFWVGQFESGAVEIDEVPEEFRAAARGEATCPVEPTDS
ncbi:MAG TPA: hypothetical protein VM618_03460 [Acidimicrobiia bacterium]|nr:hypothetical protein [Acidimicrobiia bacterium]